MVAQSEPDIVHMRSIQSVPSIWVALIRSSGSRYSYVVKGDKRTIMRRHEVGHNQFPYDK